ncbi:entry exclusion protein TrbK [Ensifer canadensis]|uniref:entry exclusion protein TrbK n=1 Tax=Ensifer canadensis TaxID=555315 RepID=UPI0035E3C165
MVKTKIIVTSLTAILSLTIVSVWLFISEKHAVQDTRAKFFGTSQKYPTSGGQKMKFEW